MSKIFSKFEKLDNELTQVSSLIDAELETNEVKFNKTVKKFFNNNAKMIRPALVLIGASYKDNYKNNENIISAAAAEMLHVASLIHDDIIDGAMFRRGMTTIHNEFDVGYAVICGDYLYAKSYQLLLTNNSISSLKYVSGKVCNMAFGEVEQYLEKFNEGLSIDKYLEIIANKSASLFQSNLIIGAMLSGVNKTQENLLADFGLNYGMMFQIQDDILDYINVEDSKPIQSDLKRGVYTLPLLLYIQTNPEVVKLINQKEYSRVIENVKSSDAIDNSIHLYEMYYINCKNIIKDISSEIVQEYLLHLLEVTHGRLK